MTEIDKTELPVPENKWRMRLAVCWICGMIVAIIGTMFWTGQGGRLEHVSDDVFKWIAQVLGPPCLLVLSRVFGRNMVQNFRANLERASVYRLAVFLSLTILVFAVITIARTAYIVAPTDTPDAAKLKQLQALSNLGGAILSAALWPILAIVLDYLFPDDRPAAAPSVEGPPQQA